MGDMNHSELVEFEIMFKAPERGKMGDGADIHQVRPPEEAFAICLKWLSSFGVSCYDSGFSLICNSPRLVLEQIFETTIVREEGKSGKAPWRFTGLPKLPDELAPYVDDVVFTVKPVFF